MTGIEISIRTASYAPSLNAATAFDDFADNDLDGDGGLDLFLANQIDDVDDSSGEVVVTDLFAHDAPLIRYRLGDLAVADEAAPLRTARPISSARGSSRAVHRPTQSAMVERSRSTPSRA